MVVRKLPFLRPNLEYNWGVWPLLGLLGLSLVLGTILLPEIFLFSNLVRFLDDHQGLFTVLGWFAITFLGIQAAKLQLKNSARLEIYKEIYDLKLKIDEAVINFGLSSYGLVMLEMKWAKEKSLFSEQKSPGQIWLDYTSKLHKQKFEFVGAYLLFLNRLNIWRAEISSLSLAIDILSTELNTASEGVGNYIDSLTNLFFTEGSDSTKWNREDMDSKAKDMRGRFDQAALIYMSDFIDLLHQELIRPIFNTKRIPREDYNYPDAVVSKTLTRAGIVEMKYAPTRIATLRKSNSAQ